MSFGLKALNRVPRCLKISKMPMTTQASEGVKNGNHKESFTVCVEGNIASGKTSFLEHFKKNQNVEIFEEPVRRWRDVHGHNALAKMYEDPSRWSLTLQTYIQLTMLEHHKKETIKPVKLMERSIYSAKYCFVENMYSSGVMHGLEYVVLTEWFNWIIKNNHCHLDLIVYLQTKPETVHKRIRERDRKEELNISMDYLEKLHALHEEWLVEQSKFSLPSKVLVIPADSSLEEMQQMYDKRKKEILCGVS
ncbi:thymidine kinase 2, mitochondrial-like [Crassostrea virginica]|uniref:Thymidine kinase 2, mitochondrial-like n=1 Tax=Crassostrea virginica TaxID=6565 RepID=A0A8B8DMH9_CRAVI|nr:thymidine kinase 2, mitochondrial-like [Crassostrea virginica]XP_022333567.1 thymidine kinase 2, mitochondrial-like [Crassostrea virginica]